MYKLGHLESFGEFKSATCPILKYSKIYPGLGSTPRENRQDILFGIDKRPTNIYTTYVIHGFIFIIFYFTLHLILHNSGITELSWS